jgi:hypothetical protein
MGGEGRANDYKNMPRDHLGLAQAPQYGSATTSLAAASLVAVLDDIWIDFSAKRIASSANMIRRKQGHLGCQSSGSKSFGKATHQSLLVF